MNAQATEVYWGTLSHPLFDNRPLHVAATENGLCRVNWPHESFADLQDWVNRRIPGAKLIEDRERVSEYVSQLKQFLDGTRKTFDLPVDLRGTPFQVSVWKALARIPCGETRSYSDIAEAVGRPNAVRAVGTANGANPVPIVVPCHRVIGKDAALTGFAGGLRVKEDLLRLEGVRGFTQKGHARFRF
ncbi:methylated-DNA--[protein]-cysteine S-methyltransferase [Cohnella sp. CFH 77786]|uniref:methylated-DNA--[protein]-cysteine S-methyltransferase n=1 Tax=Cohnella sp. CFH 77786 TaxID=2662265 RepID=UPI001C6089E5|nr:methylated-DNA--[protein]-cysteine S-methyltransferase [Cohnella sp. CFH 77786]MBW5449133.1 methylated-DNA--[protein]-cysteine S-methyltransferase [Cohnella sp. CFH 77786]